MAPLLRDEFVSSSWCLFFEHLHKLQMFKNEGISHRKVFSWPIGPASLPGTASQSERQLPWVRGPCVLQSQPSPLASSGVLQACSIGICSPSIMALKRPERVSGQGRQLSILLRGPQLPPSWSKAMGENCRTVKSVGQQGVP